MSRPASLHILPKPEPTPDPRIAAVEETLYAAALEDWRAALAWLRAHPSTKDRYETKGAVFRFSWDTDD
jgi:hypothetical protein